MRKTVRGNYGGAARGHRFPGRLRRVSGGPHGDYSMTGFLTWIERLFKWIVALLALAFLATGIAALCYGHTTVTVFDMWNLYDVALRRPFWQAVALKYGSHSIVFPTLIWLADIKLFHANQQILFIVGLIFLVASAAMLAARFGKIAPSEPLPSL